MTHSRRSENCSQCDVFSEYEIFSNKDRFVHLIGEKLEQVGCKVLFAKEDADLEIARISINESLMKNVTLIGEDTDLLLLLLFYSAKNDSSFKLRCRGDRENKRQAKTVHKEIFLDMIVARYCCLYMRSLVVTLHLSFVV